MSPFINKHLEARLLKFEHIYWYNSNENRCGICHISTVLRRYTFTALATYITTETATEQAYIPWCSTAVRLGAKTINIFRACIGAQLTICAQK